MSGQAVKPTVVIVPGAWQKPCAWDGFKAKLNEAGYPSEHVALPSVGGEQLPLTGLAEDVAEVQAVLKRLAAEGKKAVLLCHSAGGVVGSNAVEGHDAVQAIIYCSAFMIPKGKSLMDMLGGQPLPWMVIQGDRVVGNMDMLNEVAFNDLDADSQAKWCKEMTHTSAQLFATPSGYEPWANGIPCRYIFCSRDNALPLPIQQQMSQQLGESPKTATLDAGHCPFLSIPNQLLAAVNEVLA